MPRAVPWLVRFLGQVVPDRLLATLFGSATFVLVCGGLRDVCLSYQWLFRRGAPAPGTCGMLCSAHVVGGGVS